jgi:hypothetical protein
LIGVSCIWKLLARCNVLNCWTSRLHNIRSWRLLTELWLLPKQLIELLALRPSYTPLQSLHAYLDKLFIIDNNVFRSEITPSQNIHSLDFPPTLPSFLALAVLVNMGIAWCTLAVLIQSSSFNMLSTIIFREERQT